MHTWKEKKPFEGGGVSSQIFFPFVFSLLFLGKAFFFLPEPLVFPERWSQPTVFQAEGNTSANLVWKSTNRYLKTKLSKAVLHSQLISWGFLNFCIAWRIPRRQACFFSHGWGKRKGGGGFSSFPRVLWSHFCSYLFSPPARKRKKKVVVSAAAKAASKKSFHQQKRKKNGKSFS